MLKYLGKSIFLLLVLALSATTWAGEEIYWIDVRSASEFASGHVEGAVNIPHTEIVARIVAEIVIRQVAASDDGDLVVDEAEGIISIAFGASVEEGPDGLMTVTESTGSFADIKQAFIIH